MAFLTLGSYYLTIVGLVRVAIVFSLAALVIILYDVRLFMKEVKARNNFKNV